MWEGKKRQRTCASFKKTKLKGRFSTDKTCSSIVALSDAGASTQTLEQMLYPRNRGGKRAASACAIINGGGKGEGKEGERKLLQ